MKRVFIPEVRHRILDQAERLKEFSGEVTAAAAEEVKRVVERPSEVSLYLLAPVLREALTVVTLAQAAERLMWKMQEACPKEHED